MLFKILSTADLHLGKKSSSVSGHSDKSSTKFTWHRMVDWAVQNQVDAFVLAGDVIDRDNRYFEAIGPIREGFKQLGEASIPVVMIAGNHDFDVLPEVASNSEYDHVHLLGKGGRWETKAIETDKGTIQFLGWSFPKEHFYEDPLLSLSRSEEQIDLTSPTIGILHGELDDPESRYAPIAMNNLTNQDIDAWVLGHIHKPNVHHQDDPLVLYTGSPQALSPKESGPHGPYLLTINEQETVIREHILLSPIRYEKLDIDISEVTDESIFRNLMINTISKDVEQKEQELQRVSQIIYDIQLTGRHALKSEFDTWGRHVMDFEQTYVSDTTASIRTVSNKIEPKVQNLEELAGQPEPTGILARAILDLKAGQSSEFLDALSIKFEQQLSQANTASTYQPLQQNSSQYSEKADIENEFLLEECERLLASLLSQKD